MTVPQIGAMYEGDSSRKRTLVEHGFRLPSALDNRPLKWNEFKDRVGQTVYLSATPGRYEMGIADGVVEQIIRPTGLVDPEIVVKPTKGQIDDLLEEIRLRVERDERVLVTTLTKKMAEELTDFLAEAGVRVRYLHSDVDTLRRVELLTELRAGVYDVLVGINLLREGLDLPEVSLVAILDADKEGFLRSSTSLIQTIGRAARNVSGQVHMYADVLTDSMKNAIEETDRRREKQVEYNTGQRHRPDAAAQAHRRHHRRARPRGRRHRRRCSRAATRKKKSPTPNLRKGGIAAQGASGARVAHRRPQRSDARGGRRAQVRARGAPARRARRPEARPAPDGEGRATSADAPDGAAVEACGSVRRIVRATVAVCGRDGTADETSSDTSRLLSSGAGGHRRPRAPGRAGARPACAGCPEVAAQLQQPSIALTPDAGAAHQRSS